MSQANAGGQAEVEVIETRRLDDKAAERARQLLAPQGSARAVRVRETGSPPHSHSFLYLSRASDVCSVLRDPETFALSPYDDALGEITNGVSFFLSAKTETIERRRALRSEIMGHGERRARPSDFHLDRFADETARAVIDSLLPRRGPRARFDLVRDYATFVPYLTAVRAFGVAGDASPGWLVHAIQLLRVLASRRWFGLTPESQAMQSVLAWTLLPTGHIFSNVRGRDGRVKWLATAMSRQLEKQIDAALAAPEQAGPDTLIGQLEAARKALDLDPEVYRSDARAMIYEFVGSVTILVSQGFCRLMQSIQSHGNALDDVMVHMRDPETAEAYIDEAMRLHSPTGQLQRIAETDAEIDGLRIEAGDHLFLLIDQASRDPVRFAAPDSFRPGRAANAYVHFGCHDSPHSCFGQNWARAIMRKMLVQLARLPDLRFLPSSNGELREFNGFPESLVMEFRSAHGGDG